MASLKGKVIIITGASSGIGRASAVECAKYGARLVLNGRDSEEMDLTVSQCVEQGITVDQIAVVLGDLEEEATLKKIAKTAVDTFGAIDVVYNNGGYGHPEDKAIHQGGSVESLDAMYRVFLRATYVLVQECLPELEKSKGVVVNCSSAAARCVEPNLLAYSTAKAGMDHMTRGMAMGLSMKGIRVNSLNPGYVRTKIIARKFGKEMEEPIYQHLTACSPFMQTLSTPEEIARVVIFLASDQSAALTGASIACDLGLTLTNAGVDFMKLK